MNKFFNIFSESEKEKIKDIQKPKVTADYREKNSLVASELIQLGLKVEFRELKVADYLVNDVAIERKTVSDFISSMINKRLINQLESLQVYKNRLLIIEGLDEQELYTDSEEKNVRFHRRQLEIAYPRDRKSTRLNSSHIPLSRMPSSA